jgi:dolichyl-phosphooligosaccharide-protein glycotransferase
MAKKSKEKKKEQIKEQKQEKLKQNYRWQHIILLAVILVVLLYPRVVPYQRYFSPDNYFRDPDTCYHLRRIIYSATHGLQIPFYDPLLAHPHGAIPVWSPLYDWFSAFASFIFSWGHPTALSAQRISLLVTLLFGMLELVFLGLLVYKATGSKTAAMLTGLITGITDMQIKFTSLEIIDHNSLIVLIYGVLLWRTFIIFRKETPLKNSTDIVLLEVLLALLFWVWSGAYIYVAVLALIHVIYPLAARKGSLLRDFSISYLVAGVLVLPLALIHTKLGLTLLGYEHVSLFTVLFFVAASAGFYAVYQIWLWKSRSRKIWLMLSIVAAFVILAAIMIIIYKPLMEGVQYARAGNAWLSTIAESKPLFFIERGPIYEFYTDKAIKKLSYLIFIFPIAFILILLKSIKLPLELYVMLLVMTFVFGFLAWSQQKFAFEFSFPYGMVLAIFIVWSYQKLTKEISYTLIVFYAVLVALFLYPLKADFKSTFSSFTAYGDTFKWLKRDANLKDTEINSGHAQEEGIISPWDIGHHLHLYSEFPTIADNFGFFVHPSDGFYDMVRFFLSEDEEYAINLMKKYKCTYVATTFSSMYEQYPIIIGLDPTLYYEYSIVVQDGKKHAGRRAKEKFFKTLGLRLGDFYGSANPTDQEQSFEVKALKHFRLVRESPRTVIGEKTVEMGSLKIYKYVDGTPLTVPVTGNPPYKLEAAITTNTGNTFYYRQNGFVQEGIIAPYSTHQIKDYPFTSGYKVTVNDRVYEFNDVQ